jgi:adenosylhomocysteinase
MSKVKDPSLAPQGKMKIEWAESHMPVLMAIKDRFLREKPLKGWKIGICLHVTKETAVLVRTLLAGGAEVVIASCNPLSTQDDVAAALAKETEVYAIRGESTEEYYDAINKVLDTKPQITIDDGCDLVVMAHTKRTDILSGIKGGCEETTTGILRLLSMEKDGALKYPIINVNDAKTKHLFDNFYGTGQSVIDGIMRATNVLIAGKRVVIIGYGYCGGGIARNAKGLGAHVVVCDVDPVKALRAWHDGFEVMPVKEAAKIGDIFITVTGCKNALPKETFSIMKDGAILSNAGHFNVEIDVESLYNMAKSRKEIRPNVEKITLQNGKNLYLLGEGRLVNLACAEGHPSEIMDFSFATQSLSIEYLTKNIGKLGSKVHKFPEELENQIAQLKLKTLGINIDKLTSEQVRYLTSWKEGT